MNSVPYSGPDAPPTFMTRVMPIALSASGSGLAAMRVDVGQHRLEAALHVEPVIGIADRRVERRQLLGMGDEPAGHGFGEFSEIGCHGQLAIRLPCASK